MNFQLNETDRINIEKSLSEELAEFVQLAWHINDPGIPYRHNWHMDAICEHLEAVARRDIIRLLINVPPGTSKSSATSVFFPAWLWGPFGAPQRRFIGASHEQGLAIRDNRKCRILIESDWYQKRWPVKLAKDQNEKSGFENEFTGWRQATAVKSMTGKRGDDVVWDDPQSPEKAYSDQERETANRVFDETLPLRLNDPETSSITIIQQRLHENDVTGHILAKELGYEYLMLPMEFEPERRCYTAVVPRFMESRSEVARFDPHSGRWYTDETPLPDDPVKAKEIMEIEPREVYLNDPRKKDGDLLFEGRFPLWVVERDKKVLGEFATAGQFQQRPAPRGGALFKQENIHYIETAPAGVRWCRGWDFAASTAIGSAFTAGVLVGFSPDGRTIIGHAIRGQWTPGKVESTLVNIASGDGVQIRGSIPQDPGQAGKAQAQYFIKKLRGYKYEATPESGDKVERAGPLASQFEANNVDIVRGAWNADFENELLSFPFGTYKDQVDAATRAFNSLSQGSTYRMAL